MSDREVQVWDFAGGGTVFKDPIAVTSPQSAGFTPDGKLLVTASGHADRRAYGRVPSESLLRTWDARSGEPRAVLGLQRDSETMKVAFTASRDVAAVTSGRRSGDGRNDTFKGDSVARLWDVGIRDRRLAWSLDRQQPVSSVEFSADGRRVLTVAGSVARISDAATGQLVADLSHAKDINTAAFSPDARLAVTASDDGTARIWDAETGQQRFAATHQDAVKDAALVAGGRMLATISGGKVRLWTVTSGTAAVNAPRFEAPDDVQITITRDPWLDNVTADGSLLVTREAETAKLWDVTTGKLRFTLKHDGWVRSAALIAGGSLLVTGADEKIARVWDTLTGTPKYQLEHAGQLSAVAVSPDERTVLTAEADGTVHLWDVSTGRERRRMQQGCPVDDLRVITDGTGDAGGALAMSWTLRSTEDCPSKVVVWDLATGAARSSMNVHGTEVLRFSRDGKVMVSRDDDGKRQPPSAFGDAGTALRVWDVDSGEERFADPFRSEDRLPSLALSPDGSRLLAGGGQTASMWSVSGTLLQAALAAATSACLPPEFRRQNLGESEAEARRAFEACEHRHGRR
jgi:WD40 repeat protein